MDNSSQRCPLENVKRTHSFRFDSYFDQTEAILTDVEHHAVTGCRACILVVKVCQKLPEPASIAKVVLRGSPLSVWSGMLAWTKPMSEHSAFGVNFFVLDGQPKLLPSLPVLRPRANLSTLPDERMSTVDKWFSECQSSHKCQKLKPWHPTYKMPKRVLYVRDDTLRLVEGPKTAERYVTMSYCWGGFRPACLTTRSTLDRNLNGIELESLPDTFKDAVRVTRKLGVPYIWIDSLCILQDDEWDWKTESAKMAEIYENAYVTICATLAADSTTGLWPRNSDPLHTFERVSVEKDGNSYEVLFEDSTAHYARHFDMKRYHGQWTSVPDVPQFFTRAWIFQERLLSPRLLHFAGQEMLWQCWEMKRCECDPNKDKSCLDSSDRDLMGKQKTDAGWHWMTLVEKYSRLHLSNYPDILPAISGIAKRFGRHNRFLIGGNQYLAGLWERSFPATLLWHVLGTRQSRPERYTAPSWSWACLPGSKIAFERGAYHTYTCARLVRSAVVSEGPDKTGRLTDGSIVLRGPVQAVTVSFVRRGPDYGYSITMGDEPPVAVCCDSTSDIECGTIRTGTELLCVRLTSLDSVIMEVGEPITGHSALVLAPFSASGNKGVYRRVGCVFSDDTPWWSAEWGENEVMVV